MERINVELELIVYLVVSYALGLLGIWFMRKKITMWIAQSTWEFIVSELQTPENQKALAENIGTLVLEPIRQRIFGTLGGLGKGVSNQLKGLEDELISTSIDEASGLPMGEMALGLMKKYPILKQALPLIIAQLGKKQGGTQGGLP